MRIRMLGGVSAVTDDGRPIDIGPAKCQALLAALALSPGSAVPVPRLVDLVWGAEAPRTAEKTLQSYVARLRKGLGPDAIGRIGNAYRLDVAPESVDVARFQHRLENGDLSGALAEWQGTPLAGLGMAGLDATVAGLTEQWLTAVELDLERQVASEPAAAVGRLTELTTAHPFREDLWALLMAALYASGRQADALAAYRRARTHLVEELGVEPGPRLTDLERSILGHDEQLRPQSRSAAATTPIPTGTVTFAFSEVEGTARLWATYRHATADAIARFEDLVRSTAEAHGGYLFATGGDSVGLAFNRAGDAARFATDLQRSIDGESWPGDVPIRARIGLHSGDAEERAGSYFGPAVNIAARIAAIGHGGQSLVSGVTAALLQDQELRDLGTVQLPGVVSEQRVLQIGSQDHPRLNVQGRRRGNLPRPPGRLFGREQLLDVVTSALETSPVVTLVGPGGIGKTRLSLEAARLSGPGLAEAVWLIELAEVTSPDDVTRAVADALDVKEVQGRRLIESVVNWVAARDALLVLDNCEHVIDGAAELVEAIIAGAPDVVVLATSREGLGIAGEQLVAVGPIDAVGPGVALFTDRAALLDRHFDVELHRSEVEEICRRLDGVPLAIELAAARIQTLSPADMVARLDESFRFLTAGRRKTVERHRTLRTTIQWSFDLLSDDEQTLFRRLSVFAGSFDLAAVESVAADESLPPAEVNELLGDLVDRSMVVTESGSYGRRFRLLEIVRQFGAEQLAERDEVDVVATRLARHVAAELHGIAELLAGPKEVEGVGRLMELWSNLRAVVEWAVSNRDLDLAVSLIGPVATQNFMRRGLGELADWSESVMELADPDDDETIAQAQLWSALHHMSTMGRDAFAEVQERFGRPDHILAVAADLAVADDDERMLELGPEIIAALRSRGDEYSALLFEIFLGGAMLGAGRVDEVGPQLEDLAARLRATGPPTFLNWTLFMLGSLAEFQSDMERAEVFYAESLAVVVPPRTNSPNETLEARTAFHNGDQIGAFAMLRQYIDELIGVRNASAAGFISLEFVKMMVAGGWLGHAAKILGYLDTTGILDSEGPGFHQLVTTASAEVNADPDAAEIRRSVGTNVDDEWVLLTIRDMLDEFLDSDSTGATPGDDRQVEPSTS